MATKKNPIEPVLQQFLHMNRLRQIPSGQIILYAGDMPIEVFILRSGVVKMYDIDEQGNEKILHLVKAPAVLPFAFFSGLRDPIKWFYVALTDCEVYVVQAKDLESAMLENSALAHLLTREFSYDVHEVFVRLSSLSKTNVRDKLIAALKFLAECHSTQRKTGWWRVDFAVSHQLLGDLCGITRESAATVMKGLHNEKIVRSPKLTVLEINRQALEIL
jgi:CRP/FNR family transcriptional regulator